MTEGTNGTGDAGTGEKAGADAGSPGGTTGVPAAGAGAAAAPWHGVSDADAAAYITNKGWTSPGDMLRSYQGAEKLIGRDPATLIPLPRADDPAGQREVFGKMGMPATSDLYELSKPEGGEIDATYAAWAKETFHELGLTAAQAKGLSAKHNEFLAKTQVGMDTDYNMNYEADKQALLAEWRGGHDRMVQNAKSAASTLGFAPEVIDAIEGSLGYAGTMKLFASLGTKMGEEGFVSSDGSKGGAFGDMVTPAEAKQQWEATKMDANFQKALFDNSHPGHAGAKEKQTKLFAIMYPNG